MLVFDRRSLRCVVPPTEDCDIPTTPAPLQPEQEEGELNIPRPGSKTARQQQQQQQQQEFPNLPPGAIPILPRNKARN